jgi:hypothetical protein
MSGQASGTFSVLPRELTRQFFQNDVIVRYGVPGDGTCFYYSLCAILNIDNFLHQPVSEQVKIGRSFRCSLTNDLTWEEWTSFLKLKGIEEHKIHDLNHLTTKLCSYRVWANEPVIRFIMYKFKVNLIFLDERLKRLYCGVDEPESNLTAVVFWVNKSHFEPLGRLNALDITQDRVAVQFQFVRDKDHEFIHNLMSKYKEQCEI